MASSIPHPPYAEDQPYAKTLLTYHVCHRFLQTGAFFGLPIGAAASVISARRAGLPISRSLLSSAALRSTGRGALIGLALGIPATFGRMRGRDEIEWKDRTWRLLENRGQMEVEVWSSVGFLAGALVAVRRGVASKGVVSVLGGATVGDLAGVLGYMGWRYGVKGGKWKD